MLCNPTLKREEFSVKIKSRNRSDYFRCVKLKSKPRTTHGNIYNQHHTIAYHDLHIKVMRHL